MQVIDVQYKQEREDQNVFKNWLFSEMERTGIVKNYDKNPHTGKGRKPVGNFSVNMLRINEFKQSEDINQKVWGIVAYCAFISKGVVGAKTQSELASIETNPDFKKLSKVVAQSAKLVHNEFTTRYRKV